MATHIDYNNEKGNAWELGSPADIHRRLVRYPMLARQLIARF